MKSATSFLESVLAARALPGADDRRGVARVALTVFGRSLGDGPSGLSTADFELLVTAAATLIDEKLVGDGGAPPEHVGPAGGAALYEITAALPRSPLRSELGRSVAALLYQGAAPTFAAVARRMALTGARALAGPGVEARIELSMFLPLDIDDGIDGFALALATQRELATQWVITASTRSLAERRLAARLLLRATREATRRARAGDHDALTRLLEEPPLPPKRSTPPPPSARVASQSTPPPRAPRASTIPPPVSTLAATWEELIGEREGAVWKYAAAARGLVAGVAADAHESIVSSLALDAGATAWRRAACALGASLATSEGDDAFLRAIELARSPMVERDPGVLTALVWGLSVAADVEPEACDELLAEVARIAPITIAEPLVELRREVRGAGDRARTPCRDALTASLERGDSDLGLVALARDVRDELDGTAERRLQQTIDSALMVFGDVGAAAAHARAATALAAADDLVKRLEQLADAPPEVRARRGTCLVREADSALLESRLLPALFGLGTKSTSGERPAETAAVASLDERLAVLLLARESREPDDAVTQLTHHQRNLRALLHLVDAASSDDVSDERREQLRVRCERVVVATAARLAAAPTSPLSRATAATLARALDALVRHGFADAADVWLFAGARDLTDAVIAVLAEASRNPDVIAVLEPGASFAAQVREGRSDRGSASDTVATEARIGALSRLSNGMHAGVSQGGDHLRRSLGRLARDLESLLADPTADRADSVTRELDALRPLVTGAVQRCAGRTGDRRGRVAAPPAAAATRISFGGLADWVKDARTELPRDVARLAEETFRLAALRMPEAPEATQAVVATETGVTFVAAGAAVRGHSDAIAPAAPHAKDDPGPAQHPDLPPWIPRRRTLGGFFVHERLGFGASGSVFVVTRVDDHDDPDAERYALKVPEWDAATSRTLSETEFMRLFRSEASALMELPEHPNLARFVTFDAGARPKPILVMELVLGESCERQLAAGKIDVPSALDVIDGVLAGLVAMHAAGVGHLDLKPSNVILREAGDGGAVPVLVDFGLAGRRLRPGCGTVAYGAPEVWLEIADVSPTRTDMYAFACFAYEMLTGKQLFAAPSDHAVVAAHLTHDGGPPALERLGDGPAQKVVALLSECLRRDPAQRPTALDLRRRLSAMRASLVGARWPIGA